MIKVIFAVCLLAAGSVMVFNAPEAANAGQSAVCGLRCGSGYTGLGQKCGCARIGSDAPDTTSTTTAN